MFKLSYPKFWQSKNILSYLLWLPSQLYFFAGVIRLILAKPITIAPIKLICVGNATVGGTGKTQIVIWLVNFLKTKNINCLVVTKAYKGRLKGAMLVSEESEFAVVGDESVMLAQYTKVIAARKFHYAVPIIQSLKPAVVIVDDGLQNPNFIKDFNILSIDSYRGFGNHCLLPAGPLRQHPAQAFSLADTVIIVGGAPEDNDGEWAGILKGHNKPTFSAKITPSLDIDKSVKYFAFSGIGNPERFLTTLKSTGANIVGYQHFPDHHIYTIMDCKHLQQQAMKLSAKLITTSKDYVKIRDMIKVQEFAVSLVINNQELLENLIYEYVIKKNQTPN